MTRIAVALCALGLAGVALGAIPAEEFTARGKELLANKEARDDAERLRRLLETHIKEWVAKRRAA